MLDSEVKGCLLDLGLVGLVMESGVAGLVLDSGVVGSVLDSDVVGSVLDSDFVGLSSSNSKMRSGSSVLSSCWGCLVGSESALEEAMCK